MLFYILWRHTTSKIIAPHYKLLLLTSKENQEVEITVGRELVTVLPSPFRKEPRANNLDTRIVTRIVLWAAPSWGDWVH